MTVKSDLNKQLSLDRLKNTNEIYFSNASLFDSSCYKFTTNGCEQNDFQNIVRFPKSQRAPPRDAVRTNLLRFQNFGTFTTSPKGWNDQLSYLGTIPSIHLKLELTGDHDTWRCMLKHHKITSIVQVEQLCDTTFFLKLPSTHFFNSHILWVVRRNWPITLQKTVILTKGKNQIQQRRKAWQSQQKSGII